MSDPTTRMRAAFARITRWMNDHEAPLLAENLAPGAPPEALDEAEAALGVGLPADLRALWSLHDGQDAEGNGFVESYDLLSIAGARGEQESLLMALEFAREHPAEWEGTPEELASDAWLPFAARDSDSLAVCLVSGRVFQSDHDDRPKLLAPSLLDWLEGYAARIEADDYRVEEGFGDYYLALRDRAAEARDEERSDHAAAHANMRAETPLGDQLARALRDDDADRCQEIFEDARERSELAPMVAQLFAAKPKSKLVAGALRTVLRDVTLTPEQWKVVAAGGASLANNAIRDIALARHEAAKRDAAPAGGWLTRLFGKKR